MMQPPDTPCITDTASSFGDADQEGSSLLLQTPSLCASNAPSIHGSTVSNTPSVRTLTASPTPSRQFRSKVWRHFTRPDDFETSKKAICMHCSREIAATGGSTTGMHTHLKKCHPDILAGSEPLAREVASLCGPTSLLYFFNHRAWILSFMLTCTSILYQVRGITCHQNHLFPGRIQESSFQVGGF
jgi:hypothetical protein